MICSVIIDSDKTSVYTEITMLHVYKIIGGSLVVTLVSLMGGLCVSVMPAQAMTMSSVVESDDIPMTQRSVTERHIEGVSSHTPMTTMGMCNMNCVSVVSCATLNKKFDIDTGTAFSSGLVSQFLFLMEDCVLSMPVGIDASPPISNVLFSVFKKE